MPHSDSQLLFVYGTLRSHEPEHKRYCSQLLSPPRKARVPGRLFELQEKYPLAVIDSEQILKTATTDSTTDWLNVAPPPLEPRDTAKRIVGEFLELPLGNAPLIAFDQWEGFEPKKNGIYQRMIVIGQDADGSPTPCWIYASTTPPAHATPLGVDSWTRPESR